MICLWWLNIGRFETTCGVEDTRRVRSKALSDFLFCVRLVCHSCRPTPKNCARPRKSTKPILEINETNESVPDLFWKKPNCHKWWPKHIILSDSNTVVVTRWMAQSCNYQEMFATIKGRDTPCRCRLFSRQLLHYPNEQSRIYFHHHHYLRNFEIADFC